jgi:ubiquinone/menaquinone biosynthesis C-methylase UbiE
MENLKSKLLFNLIAPVYALFYNSQKKSFVEIIKKVKNKLDLSSFKTTIDVGCGTGALCSALVEQGFEVTGVDNAKIMLDIANRKAENKGVKFVKANILEKLPYEDNSFDLVFASYVVHGLKLNDRKKMYIEMNRVAKNLVIIHDYNSERALFTSIIEFVEGGDYFNFIKKAKEEMDDIFSSVDVINVGKMANWYVCKPTNHN